MCIHIVSWDWLSVFASVLSATRRHALSPHVPPWLAVQPSRCADHSACCCFSVAVRSLFLHVRTVCTSCLCRSPLSSLSSDSVPEPIVSSLSSPSSSSSGSVSGIGHSRSRSAWLPHSRAHLRADLGSRKFVAFHQFLVASDTSAAITQPTR